MAFPIFWMIREDSSVDAPHSFEVSVPCTLARHHASHAPCDVSSRRCFPAADAGCAILGYPCRRETRCTTTPVFIRQRFAASCCLLRSALFSDSCCSGTMCGCRHFLCKCGDYLTGVEASRQLVMMQPWPPSLPAEAHFSADYPLRRTAAPLWYPSPCLVCMFFLRSGSFSYGIREEYDTPAWSGITPAVEALR
jgi:hypothetical protein